MSGADAASTARGALAMCLIVLAGWAFIAGTSPILGSAIREWLRPALQAVRRSTDRSRSKLADLTVVVAVVFAVASIPLDSNPLAAVVAIVLWMARPQVARLTSEEHPLLAKAGEFSADLIIGIYAPIMAAMLLLGDIAMAASLLTVTVALCWPPGNEGTRVRTWRPNWANTPR